MTAARKRLRDLVVPPIVPYWLTDRGNRAPSPLNVGYRILYVLFAILDCFLEFAFEGVQAAWPGIGTTTALPLIGQSRGIVQGETETAQHYAARLQGWLEAHAEGGTVALARQIHEYVGDTPRVRIVSRRGDWVTVDAAGVVSFSSAAWDWDSISNPERAGDWSDIWIVVYTDASYYGRRAGTLGALTGDDGFGLGLLIPHASADAIRKLLDDWKGAHSRCRAVIFCSDAAKFDPDTPGSFMPNGTWGEWELPGSDPRVAGGRDLTTCRYMEPN